VDISGSTYLGLQLDWNYKAGLVDISMPGYVAKALQRFEHPTPSRPQLSPHATNPIQFGVRSQLTETPDTSPPMSVAQIKRLQQIAGVFLYYARAVDSSMLVALGSLAALQTKATQKLEAAITQFLDYASSNPSATVRFRASEMVLYVHSDASYLSESGARSRAGGIFFLSGTVAKDENVPLNGAVHVTSTIMKNVLASVAEAEIAALFYNAQEACEIRTTLADLGHSQPPTLFQTDNSCAAGILNQTVKQKRSKAIDMRFYWLRDRVEQKQFQIIWKPGDTNMGDYFTKHHPAKHHQAIRHQYLLSN
jgi:hypothetical protein